MAVELAGGEETEGEDDEGEEAVKAFGDSDGLSFFCKRGCEKPQMEIKISG